MKGNGKLHFIALGGNVMHALAIACKAMGHTVSGSDDQIYEPSLSKLKEAELLPEQSGWDESRITEDLTAVILGMHAKEDNPELVKAQQLGLPIYSFPEFIYQLSEDKQRIVVAGSHGKTTITAMIIHVLKYHNRDFDYLIGAPLEGLENLVRVSDAPIIIIEGDEYFSSAIDKRPKLVHYRQHIGLISGISWDHVNAFPSVEKYVAAFEDFADRTPKAGSLAYYEDDPFGTIIGNKDRFDVFKLPYGTHNHKVKDGKTYLITSDGEVEVKFFGAHNLQNVSGAREVLKRIGISEKMFYDAIGNFRGASKRMELIKESGNYKTYVDYAHSPSKVTATINAVKNQFPNQKLTAVLELHTFSSLDPNFISEYKDSFKNADNSYVFVNPDNIKLAQENGLTDDMILKAFDKEGLRVVRNKESLASALKEPHNQDGNLLLMSSGNFGGLNLKSN